MEAAIHRFVRLLRLHGIRIGVSEAMDAMSATATAEILADRELLRSALEVCLVKDRRDEATFHDVFDRFFALRPVLENADAHGHSHTHDDLSDSGELTEYSLSDEISETPQQGHSHGPPSNLKEYFDPEDLAEQYNLHQEANRLDMASLTDEIVLSSDEVPNAEAAARVQLTVSRLANPGRPGDLVTDNRTQLDVELSVAQEMALLTWLDDPDAASGPQPDAEELAALRSALAGLLDGLPEKLRDHLEQLMATDHQIEEREVKAEVRDLIHEHERASLEDSIRRLIRSLHGAPRARRKLAARGTVDAARTMRANLRYDGVPFRPITVAKVEDRPSLLILADVSLSVRTAARFTLQLVHGLQSMVAHVRSFAFVADLVEITDLFAEHQPEEALSLVVSGLQAGGVLDTDADSDYGLALGKFLEEYGGAVTRRTTVIVLGDGRNNGRDPNFEAFEEISRRARETIWITPEAAYSWGLGSCDLPAYATYCDRVHVVHDLAELEQVSVDAYGA
ncbi:MULTISPECIES: VWA domain-containing protein [unclassified Gordonia (in: high G+C Gram-positive bacteria)]|uniref:VWA domain-containing protein n=1 Tax=unclassified Gordonia (in: high G+C Gram-positive bacteria) TaxID=2657482 RepID=UPI001F0F0C77|nr:VWA domain-containing protein [Gordonia sp. ABSL49_1]MCH5644323.1 VWA domain-containing protein [Gordonia sp. ABSL49_1]